MAKRFILDKTEKAHIYDKLLRQANLRRLHLEGKKHESLECPRCKLEGPAESEDAKVNKIVEILREAKEV